MNTEGFTDDYVSGNFKCSCGCNTFNDDPEDEKNCIIICTECGIEYSFIFGEDCEISVILKRQPMHEKWDVYKQFLTADNFKH